MRTDDLDAAEMKFAKLVELARRLPDDAYFSFSSDVDTLNVQAPRLEDVKRFRQALKHGVWHKLYRKDCKWWQYEAVWYADDDNEVEVSVQLYACKETPPTCRIEYVEETVEVPACEAHTITVKKARVICGNDAVDEVGL